MAKRMWPKETIQNLGINLGELKIWKEAIVLVGVDGTVGIKINMSWYAFESEKRPVDFGIYIQLYQEK